MLSEAYLRRLDAFALSLRAYARGTAGGLRRSRALGSSVEFSDFRDYSPGDDLRRVDWNACARFDKLFLKLFLEEQETTVRVLLDASASMGMEGKWEMACRLCATLCYLALTRYDRACVCVLQGGQVRASRLFAGRPAFAQAEAFIEGVRPAGETRLNDALLRVPAAAGRGVCVLVSDLLCGQGWEKGAKSLLLRRQEVSVLQVLSEKECAPDFTGTLRLLDSEGEGFLDVRMTPDTLRLYEQALAAFLREQRAFCHAQGMPHVLVRSDADPEHDVLRALAAGGVIAPR